MPLNAAFPRVSAPQPLLSLPALPKAGNRVDLPLLAGSSDALALAICHLWRGAGADRIAAAVAKQAAGRTA